MTTIEIGALSYHPFCEKADGTRNYGIDGFDGATVLVSGEQAALTAEQICRAFVRATAAESRIAELERELAAARAALPPKRPTRLLGPGCVRQDPANPKVLWLLNKAEKGWSSFGVRIDGGWDELFRSYDVIVSERREDKDGQHWIVEPRRSPIK